MQGVQLFADTKFLPVLFRRTTYVSANFCTPLKFLFWKVFLLAKIELILAHHQNFPQEARTFPHINPFFETASGLSFSIPSDCCIDSDFPFYCASKMLFSDLFHIVCSYNLNSPFGFFA